MLKHKIVPMRFHANQLHAMAGYLEQQAGKGWFLDYDSAYVICQGFLILKKGEPKQRSYSVVLIPGTSEWDDPEDERIVRYREMCEEYDWELEGKYFRYFVLCSDNPEGIPVETDDKVWFESAAREIWTKTFPVCVLLFLASFILLWVTASDPSGYLFDNGKLLQMVFMAVISVIMGALTAWYIRWFWITGRLVEQGGKVTPISLRAVIWSNSAEKLAWVFWVLTCLGYTELHYTVWYYLLLTVLVAVLLVLLVGGFRLVKKFGDGDEKENNMIWTVMMFVAVLFVAGGGITMVGRYFPEIPLYEERNDTKESLDLPVDLEMYGYVWDSRERIICEKSILGSRERISYYSTKEPAGAVSVEYDTTSFDLIYRIFLRDKKIGGADSARTGAAITESRHGVTIRRYRYDQDGGFYKDGWYLYILDNGTDILKLEFETQPDEEVIDEVAEAFAASFSDYRAC